MKTFGFTLVVLGLVLALVPAQAQGSTSFTLTTHTEGSDFSFKDATSGAKNPTLNAAPGEQITITIRNADNGFHNIHVLGSVEQKSSDVSAEGEEATVTFTAPASGSVTYQCDYHLTTMKGTINFGGSGTTTPTSTTNGDDKNESPGVQVVGVAIALLGAALILRRK